MSRRSVPGKRSSTWRRSRERSADPAGALSRIPVEDAFPGPEQHAVAAANLLQHATKVTCAMRRAHDVRMHDQCHHARGVARIVVELLELVDRAVVVLARR